MSKRYWCPQAWSPAKGWIDLPSLASQKQKKANDMAKAFAEENHTPARIIRKPHSWEPRPEPEAPEPEVPEYEEPEPPILLDTSVIAPQLPEDSSSDRARLERETAQGNLPCAVRLSRLMQRGNEHEKLVELAITSYYSGWDQLFCDILKSLSWANRIKLQDFIRETADQEFLHLFEETK